MRAPARRLDGGKPLREAMEEGGLNRLTLSAKTKELDEHGIGVSPQLIAFLSTDKPWGRETTSARSATLIAKGLDKQEDALFAMPEISIPSLSTQN